MKTNVTGVVVWDDNKEPVALSRVDVVGAMSGQVLGYSSVDAKGRFKLPLNGDSTGPGEDVFFVVTYREKEQLLSTRETPARLAGAEVQVQLAVPHARRPAERERKRRPVIQVGGFDLDAAAFARAEPTLVLQLARAVVDRSFERSVRDQLVALSPRIVPSEFGRRTLSVTPIIGLIEEIMRRKEWPRELRLKVDDILHLRRTDTDWPDRGPLQNMGGAQAQYTCGEFVIDYDTTGPGAVDPTFPATVTEPGNLSLPLAVLPGLAPSYVEAVCYWLNRALATYTAPPFSLRDPAANGKISVAITDTIAYGGAGGGTILINNALPPEILCAVAVHELFHLVRELYFGKGPWYAAMNEGMAVWAEDNFADLLNRYLDEAGHNFNGDGYMVTPERSLESGPFDYKTSLFWRYIAEQQSALTSPANEPAIGANVIGEILDTCNSQGWVWFGLMEALRKLPWYQDFFFFEYADQAQTQLKRGETTFGNFALAAYLKDLGPNVPDRRFTFMEAAEEIRLDDFLQPIEPSEPSQKYLLPVSLAGTGLVSASAGNYFADSLDRFASRYYEIKVDPSAATLEFQFNADPGLNSVLFQAVLIDKNNKVREIYRSARTNYRKRFPNARNNVLLDRIALVASGCDSDGGFTLGVGAIKDPSPDVMITRWHTALQTEYEIDSRNWSWTWVSPDIWTNNAIVYFNTNNKLNVRLHNKGNMDGGPISITLDYQDASGVLPNPPWLPVCDLAGANQDLYGLSLPAQSSNTWQVDWCPVPSGFSHHFCIRVKVLSLGEVNTDNKCAFSNFGHVVTPYGGAGDVSLPRGPGEANRSAPVEMLAVPRFGHEFELARRDLREQRVKLLEPGETSQDALRIYHRPAERKVAAQAPAPQVAQHASARPCTAPPRPSLRVPDPYGDYPADPRTLPPGVAGKPMVTLVYRRGNQVTGGITLLLSHGDKPAGQ